MKTSGTGTLYIVATPIGNLEDMTYRAVRVLQEADLIAAEDTRHTRKLLAHFGIATRLTPYHDHNEQLKTGQLLDRLREGDTVALVTDAGTPCIADPGYRIVSAAAAEGIRIVPIPGPSALIAALSASGLATDRFAFEGFLPPKQGKRKNRLEELKGELRVLIFYEAPHRLPATLTDMAEVYGNRYAVIARELTKIHEELVRGTLPELAGRYSTVSVKGEVVILLAPPDDTADSEPLDLPELLSGYIHDDNLSIRDAVAKAVTVTGISRSEVYDTALKIKNRQT